MRAILIIVLVVGGLVGLLLTLRNRNVGMPSAEVMKRAEERAREQAAAEKDE
jgi:hypothetical protein